MINLKDVITKYPDCINNGTKLKNILADLYPQEKLYAGILSDMLSDGIVAEIKSYKELDSLTFKNLCERVENNRGLVHKHVEGCLNIWANAFDIKINTPPAPPKLTPVQKTHRKIEEIDELHEHKYTKTVIPPTCTEKGYTLHTCDCGYEYKDNFVNAKHDLILVEYAEPTCEKTGQETYKCSQCGYEKKNVLSSTGHKFGKWIEQIKPTCTESGTEVRQCSKCGKKESKSVDAIGHSFSDWRVEGDFKIRDCKNCGATEKIDLKKEREDAEKKRQEEEKKNNYSPIDWVKILWILVLISNGLSVIFMFCGFGLTLIIFSIIDFILGVIQFGVQSAYYGQENVGFIYYVFGFIPVLFFIIGMGYFNSEI